MTERARLIFAAWLCGVAAGAGAQPVVSNVSFTQGDNGSGETQVVITYDLSPCVEPCNISVEMSQDGGVTFAFPVTSVTGAVGSNEHSGTGKTIIWDIAADYPNMTIANAAFRVTATDSLIPVPAGTFSMGDPWSEGDPDELPVHSVTLSTYEIGRCEVTNAEYCAYLNSALASSEITVSGGVVSRGGQQLCDTASSSADSQIDYSAGLFRPRTRDGHDMATHPVIMVSWYGAAAYCNWLSRQQGMEEVYTESGSWDGNYTQNGYRLPSEAEWERAAGWEPGHGHWRYGFMGDAIDFSRANHHDGSVYANPLSFTSTPYTSSVGFYDGVNISRTGPTVDSPSDAGCYDMSGNVWEWCEDWWHSNYTGAPSDGSPWVSPTSSYRLLRGGSWHYFDFSCRSANRGNSVPASRDNFLGFRVARTP